MSKTYGEFRWCFPKFIVYRPATIPEKPKSGFYLNRYPDAVIGAAVIAFGRVWGVQWKRS